MIAQIDQELIQALKTKDEVTISSLRNLKAAIQNAEILARRSLGEGGEKQKPLTDDEVLSVIAKKVKQHKDSITGFKQGNREDLVAHEQQQMAVLAKFLSKEMSEAEVTQIVKDIITKLSATPTDFGKVMKEVVAQVKGRVDGSIISKVVKEELK